MKCIYNFLYFHRFKVWFLLTELQVGLFPYVTSLMTITTKVPIYKRYITILHFLNFVVYTLLVEN